MPARKKELLPPLKKREVLYSSSVPPEEKIDWGRRYLEHDRILDALDFFVQAGSREDLENMRRIAIERGDAFILRAVQKTIPELVNEEHWKALEHSARAKGLDVFAEQAARGGEVEMPVVDAVIKDDPTAHSPDTEDDSDDTRETD